MRIVKKLSDQGEIAGPSEEGFFARAEEVAPAAGIEGDFKFEDEQGLDGDGEDAVS